MFFNRNRAMGPDKLRKLGIDVFDPTGGMTMDKKDEIILKQLETIKELTGKTLQQMDMQFRPSSGIYEKRDPNGEVTLMYVR